MTHIFIATVALLMLGLLSIRPASAQTYSTSTPLYQSGTQLNPNLGIVILNATEPNFAAAAADGFTWVRIGEEWKTAEPTKGQPYNWAQLDQICTWCKKYNLKPNWLLAYGNSQYGSACSPAGITGFVNFARAYAAESVAQGISGAHYEIWNEPENFDWLEMQYNAPGANILTRDQVAQINNASAAAIHAADPTGRVCTSAYGSLQAEAFYSGLQALVQGLDYNGAFDAIGLHTYHIGQSYGSSEGANGNDNPECLMAYNSSNLSADLLPSITLSNANYQGVVPGHVPWTKNYWATEAGRDFYADCAQNPDFFSYEWVRTTLCQWMAGIQWQSHYSLDSDGPYLLQGRPAETAMKFLTTTTNGRSIASMSFPSFSGTLPPNNAIWSVTLTGSPTVQIVWVPEGSASVPVPAGWTATDMYGNSLSSQITNNALPMQESSGVYYLTNSAIVESAPLQLSQSCVDVNSAAPNTTVTATCTLKNISATSITLTPDVAVRGPSNQNLDVGSNVGQITLAPGATQVVTGTLQFSSSSPSGNYTVHMSYFANGAWYDLAPTLTLTARPGIVVESSVLQLSQSCVGVNSSLPSTTVTATCTLKNTGPASITLTPDVSVRDPNNQNLDVGSDAGTITLASGATQVVHGTIQLTSSSPTGKYIVFMSYLANGTYYNLAPNLTLTVWPNAVVESSPLQLSQSSLGINALAPNATVTATCTLKNISATSITLTPDVAVRGPSNQNLDVGSNVGQITLAPGATQVVTGTLQFSSSSPSGNYTVHMSYFANGAWYDLAPSLALTVGSDPIVESSVFQLSQSSIVVSGSSPSVIVTANCSLKNISGSTITLTPDIAARDPNGNGCDFGNNNSGAITLNPGDIKLVTASRTFTTSSPPGNYTVFMAYLAGSTWYSLTPNLTLTVTQSP